MAVSEFTIAKARYDRVAESSRAKYKSGVNQIKKWLRTTGQQECLVTCSTAIASDGWTIDLTVFTYDQFLAFLEWTMRNKTLEVPTIDGYRSALKCLYRDQKVTLPIEFGDDIKEVYAGKRLFLNIPYVNV